MNKQHSAASQVVGLFCLLPSIFQSLLGSQWIIQSRLQVSPIWRIPIPTGTTCMQLS